MSQGESLGARFRNLFRNFILSQTTIALPAVLKAVNGILTSLSAGKEIKVIFAGTPCTDGKTVYLGEPLLQSQDALDAYLSHGTHEIHHVLYSDFDEVASLGGLHSLVNALEDVRIDAIGYKKYPGGYLWRNEHFSKMARAGQLPKINEHTSPGALLCLTCYWCMTALMLEYDCSKHYSEEAKNAFVQRFGQELFERIRQKAEESVRSPNTVAVIQCAREIAQLFSQAISQKVFSEQNKSSPDQHSGDSSSKGASVLSEGKGKTPKKDKQKSEDFDALFEDDDLKDADIHRAMEEDYKNYRGATGENPTGKAAVWPTVRSELSPRVDPEFKAEAEKLLRGGSQQFHRFLQGLSFQPTRYARSGRDLEPKRLSRLYVGDTRVFRYEESELRPSVAMCVLLDRSCSMTREDMRTGSLCAQAIAGMADSVSGCRSSVYAFPGVERQTLLEVKRFDETVASCLDRFCALRPFGYTPVRQSINSAAAQLVNRKESRKIIFLITDGLCSDAELLTDIEQDLKRAGIEIVCLGIGDDIPKIFSIQSDIKYSHQMKEAAYKLLEETFRRRN